MKRTSLAIIGVSAFLVAAPLSAASAADMATKAPPPAVAAKTSSPVSCASLWDFVATACPLTWYGVTLYGTIDVGGGWQSHGAPFSPVSSVSATYFISKVNRPQSRWEPAANALSQSTVGIKADEPLGSGWSAVADLDFGFDPYSLQLANGPGSQYANTGTPLNQQNANAGSSRAGTWWNGVGYVGLSSPTYGTMTVFRQNTLTLDGVIAYDPLGASYAFSPIGWSGTTCGVGNTEDCRFTTALKYRVNLGMFRVAGFWQFGGYGQNNAADGSYQGEVGADIPHLWGGTLSVDAIGSYVRDAVALSLTGSPTNANGFAIAPFLPQIFTATISDNTSVMALAKYAHGPLTLYGGYEWIRYARPSDPQTAFTDIGGDFVAGFAASAASPNGVTSINNIAYTAKCLAGSACDDKILHVFWTGGKYAVTDNVDVSVGYYHYIQDNYFVAGPNLGCSSSAHAQCSGTMDAVSGVIDWRFAAKWDAYIGCMFSQYNGGLANGFQVRNNFDPTAGLRFRF